ncbi:MAG: hypothetical protein ACPGXZ_14015 [Saprospiraceae bacterium]
MSTQSNLANLQLSNKGELSERLIEMGFDDFDTLAEWVKNLPYQRISDKSNLGLTITENRGTCSTKHAFLKTLAIEQGWNDITLYIGIYRMKGSNTKGVGGILSKIGIDYIPEAHCYLKYKGNRMDFTHPELNVLNVENEIMKEVLIQPEQIGQYKNTLHKRFVEDWLKQEKVNYSLDFIWRMREECIQQLVEKL